MPHDNNIYPYRAVVVVVVKWSECLPSTLTIQVLIPLKSSVFSTPKCQDIHTNISMQDTYTYLGLRYTHQVPNTGSSRCLESFLANLRLSHVR